MSTNQKKLVLGNVVDSNSSQASLLNFGSNNNAVRLIVMIQVVRHIIFIRVLAGSDVSEGGKNTLSMTYSYDTGTNKTT